MKFITNLEALVSAIIKGTVRPEGELEFDEALQKHFTKESSLQGDFDELK